MDTKPATELERRLYACGRSLYRLWLDLRADQPEGEKKHSYSNVHKLVTTLDPVRDSKVLPRVIAKIEEYERERPPKKKKKS